MEITKRSEDGVMLFDEGSHSYVNTETGVVPESVTTYVKRHTNPFDAEFHATNYAIKHKMDKQAVLDMWKEKGRLSAIAGTQAHKILETYVHTKQVVIVEPTKYLVAIQKFIDEQYTTQNYIPVESEILLYDDSLCGITDVIVRDKKGDHFIFDYKFIKAVSTFGFKKMMLAPYQYLPDANFYHYSLQLSLYQRMCKKYKIRKCFIVHVKTDSYKMIPAMHIF